MKNSQAVDFESEIGVGQDLILPESRGADGDSLQNGIVILFA
ncbi:MAG TPA: hypothetical protein VGG45_11410 [Terracidiphilus sp.]